VPISLAALALRGQRLIGSLVGSRLDMAECLAFSAKHAIRVAAAEVPLSAVNAAMADVMAGKVQGRIVLRIAPDSA
jgi:propanol-preferring alcohol dehydrogenase